MTDLVAGREVDANVIFAACGWVPRDETPFGGIGEVGWYTRHSNGMWYRMRGDNFRPSTDPASALAALEATGVDYIVAKDFACTEEGRYACAVGENCVVPNGYGPTVPLAACRAILAWHAAKKGVK